ncbi:Pancreatic lipase-related protein 1-like protein [Leptotrombidium deliense]|uniref:Pancreatic lipase-related protein 1-like protein n=1 Tax=Leptotrombidium deliense TaxID=299467 RepID=A0A443SQA2_9ACAR|nr:Pancreatic lipase-related protein 1-like protein [Leptotrombidium deliense]
MSPECKFHAFACETYEKFLRGQCFDCGKDGKQCANMGYFAYKSSARGRMYLVTRETEPFCANPYKIAIENRVAQGSTWGKIEIDFHSKDANETFQLTSESDEIKEASLIQGLVVAHPKLRNITHVIMRYSKYRGWIYSGKDYWTIQKIALTNGDGESVSFCGPNMILDDNFPLHINLFPGNCTTHIAFPSARLARLVWQVVSDPKSGQPPKLYWRLAVDPYDNKDFSKR